MRVIGDCGGFFLHERYRRAVTVIAHIPIQKEEPMKIWTAPEVREQNVGLEVTSYLPADIDLI